MLDSLKQKLMNNIVSINSILVQLSQQQLIHNLSQTNLQELTNIIEGKYNIQIHPKIMTCIYSIIIMKKYGKYNTKLAIQNLCRYYRMLVGSQGKEGKLRNQNQGEREKQQGGEIYRKTRMVIANLLIRIPQFSNYKLIIKDISPQLLPMSIMLIHRDKISKQCPNIYKNEILKRYKYIWYNLIQNNENNFLYLEFLLIKNQLTIISKSSNFVQLYRINQDVEKSILFLQNIICFTNKQQIAIEELFNEIQIILNYQIPLTNEKQLVLSQVKQKQEHYIRNIKTSCLQLLRLMISKFKHYLYRKLAWITENVYGLFNRPYDAVSIDPSYLISFFQTLLEVYGICCYNFDLLVHNQNGTSLLSLISALAYNDYSNNTKPQQSLINYQNRQKSSKQKPSIHINLYNNTVIDTAYEFYLKRTTKYERQIVLQKLLQFLKIYYKQKYNISVQFYKIHEILNVLETSKNQISNKNKLIIQFIKKHVIFQNYQQIGQHFQSFCFNMFNLYIKKKKDNQLGFYQVQQMSILPTINTRNVRIEGEELSFNAPSKHKVNNESEQNYQRKTDLRNGFESWMSQKVQEKNEEINQKLQSKKECSSLNQQLEKVNNQQLEKVNDEREFIITPQL